MAKRIRLATEDPAEPQQKKQKANKSVSEIQLLSKRQKSSQHKKQHLKDTTKHNLKEKTGLCSSGHVDHSSNGTENKRKPIATAGTEEKALVNSDVTGKKRKCWKRWARQKKQYQRNRLEQSQNLNPDRPSQNSSSVVKASPSAVKASPSAVKASPSAVKISPSAVKASPSAVKASPSAVKISPSAVKDSPSAVKDSPSAVKARPSAVKASSSAVKASPSAVKARPSAVKASSSAVKASPSAVKASPSCKPGSAQVTNIERTGSHCPTTESSSSNWKELQKKIQKPERNIRKTNLQKKKRPVPQEESKSQSSEIWFDDVDEELIDGRKDTPTPAHKTNSKETLSRKSQSSDKLVKEHAFKGLTRAVALDCEMVGVGDMGKESVLARVSVVNQYGECLYDTFVRSREEVVDYRTQWSGVTPEKLENAADFLDVQRDVSELIQGRILVGHAVTNDLKVLFLDHPRSAIRDTSRYKPYKKLFKGRTPSLKNLTSRLLDVKIQTGEHNSVTDAQATMRLYTLSRAEWEKRGKSKKKPGNSKKEAGKKESFPNKKDVMKELTTAHGKTKSVQCKKSSVPCVKENSVPSGKKYFLVNGKQHYIVRGKKSSATRGKKNSVQHGTKK